MTEYKIGDIFYDPDYEEYYIVVRIYIFDDHSDRVYYLMDTEDNSRTVAANSIEIDQYYRFIA